MNSTLYRDTNSNGHWTKVFSHPALSGDYTDTSVNNNTTYFFRLTASDAENRFRAQPSSF